MLILVKTKLKKYDIIIILHESMNTVILKLLKTNVIIKTSEYRTYKDVINTKFLKT